MPKSHPVLIFVIDPGGTTGVAEVVANLNQGTVGAIMRRARAKRNVVTREVKGDHVQQAFQLAHLFDTFCNKWVVQKKIVKVGDIHLVIEDFHLRQMSADLMPVRVTCSFETVCFGALIGRVPDKGDAMYSKQSASEAKGFCSDNMIKKWELWWGRSDHERDALRHTASKLDKLLREEGR